MRGVNKVILLGTLGRDPEMKYTADGKAIANLSVATSESWTDKGSGEKTEKTEWHKVVLFGKVAEIAGSYLKKGSQCYLEGKLQTRKWQDKEGSDRYSTEIIADELQLLGGKGAGVEPSGEAQPAKTAAPKPAAQPEPRSFDDDVPF